MRKFRLFWLMWCAAGSLSSSNITLGVLRNLGYINICFPVCCNAKGVSHGHNNILLQLINMDNLNMSSLATNYSLATSYSMTYKLLGTFATLGAFYLISYLLLSHQSLKFPLVGEELGGYHKRRAYYTDHAVELYKQGYKKVIYHSNAIFHTSY